MDIKIYGAIGYTILNNSDLFKDIEILLISDMHETLTNTCNSVYEISIDKYISNLLNKNYTIILEEVPNSKELVELFPNSNHIKNLRKFYLQNIDKISGIDIRLDLMDITNIKNNNSILIKKILNIYDVYLLKSKLFTHFLLYNEQIDHSILKEYYLKLIKKFHKFIYYCGNDLYKYPKYISVIKIEIIITLLEEILSDIMELYTIMTIYDKINDIIKYNKPKKIVINCGLYHIEQLEQYLIKYLKFKIKKTEGVVKMEYSYLSNICINYIDF